jgi:hypothetical protein
MEEANLVKSLSGPKKSILKEIFLPAGIILTIILAGGGTGWFLASRTGGKTNTTTQLTGGAQVVESQKEVGIKDEKTFRDYAVGRIEINDNGEIPEGSHKLIRPGGPSQTAYLTSSVVDLNQFLGKCVEVWGETFAAQKVGWLMDVGRVKVLNSCPEGL